MMGTKKAIVLVSGGMDSLVTAAIAVKKYTCAFLHVNYGQRTQTKELQSFHKIADYYHIKDRLVVSIDYLKKIGGSSLVDTKMKIEKADLKAKRIPNTYVPFRNTHIIAIAVSWAEVIHATRIFIGAVYEDSSGYPDCRPDYYKAYNALIKQGTKRGKIKIETPIIHMSKTQIVKKGKSLNAPFELSWSCYKSNRFACGVCESCLLRLRGFKNAHMIDPIEYEKGNIQIATASKGSAIV